MYLHGLFRSLYTFWFLVMGLDLCEEEHTGMITNCNHMGAFGTLVLLGQTLGTLLYTV